MNRITRWLRGDDIASRYGLAGLNKIQPLDRLTGTPIDMRSAAKTQIVATWDLDRAKWTMQTLNHFDNHAYRINALVFDCVQFMAEAAGTAPLRTRVEKTIGQYEWARDGNDLDNLLKRPNPGQGGSTFQSLMVLVMCVMGFALIEKERDRAGRVIGLWVMRSDWARPIRRADGTKDWEYRVPGREPRILKSEDSIVIPYAETPDQRSTGIGPIEVAFRSVETLSALTDFLKKFMDRGAMQPYFAVPNTEGTFAAQWSNPATVAAFRKQFGNIFGGDDSEEAIVISPGIKDIKQLGFSIDELAFGDLRDINDSDVCQAFGIPPQLVGVKLQYSTYSNMAEARQQFYEGRMTSLWSRIDDAFSRSLLPEFFDDPRYDLAFDTSDVVALQEDNDKKSARAVSWFDSGLASSHVAQKEAGIEPHGPDHFKYPLMVQLVPAVTEGQRSITALHHWYAYKPGSEMGQRILQGPNAYALQGENGGVTQVYPLAKRAAFDGDAQVDAALIWFDAMFPEYKGILRAGEDGSSWTYDADAKTYVNVDGKQLSQSDLIDLRDESADALGVQLADMVETEFDDPKGTEGEQYLMYAIVALFLLGRGGRQRADANDAGTIAVLLTEQTGYWRGFVTDLQLGQLTLPMAIARAHLYGIGPVKGYDQGLATAWGAQRALPYYPGDSATLCKARCRCFWAYSQRTDGSQSAYWLDRGDEAECEVCRGRGSTYPASTPFQLRGPDPGGKEYPAINMIAG